jgi:gluconolactonase
MGVERDNGLSSLLVDREPTRLCSGFEFTEGPVWVSERDALLFSDIPANAIYQWRPATQAAQPYRQPSGHSNGLTLDRNGYLLACEHSGRRVSRAAWLGPATAVASHWQDKRLNSPNDIVVHRGGAIYFTDPDYGFSPGEGEPGAVRELDFHGVYRISPAGELDLLTDTVNTPNGLAFSPDESILYVGDSRVRNVQRFPVLPDGMLGPGELFVDMGDDPREGVTDGMKADEAGRLWITGPGGIWVVDPDGSLLGEFILPELPANLTFGGEDFSTLFVTARTSVYQIRTRVRGIAPGSR